MKKFRMKPVVVEAVQFTGKNAQEVVGWIRSSADGTIEARWIGGRIEIRTPLGTLTANESDWITRSMSHRHFLPVGAAQFEDVFEAEAVE